MKPVWVLSQCGPKGELLPHPNLPGCEVYQGPSFKQMLVPTWDLQGHVDGFGIREGGAGGGGGVPGVWYTDGAQSQEKGVSNALGAWADVPLS